jgi:hypothetical protein
MGETGRRPSEGEPEGSRLVHEETMCCGYKKCPTVRQFDDGSAEITDDDAEGGSVGTVKLRPEQARRLGELLARSATPHGEG